MAKYKNLKANVNLDTESLFFDSMKMPLFSFNLKENNQKKYELTKIKKSDIKKNN